MNFKVMNFMTIRMSVSNIGKSRDWFAAYFGIRPLEDLENFVSFQIGDTCFDISLADEKSPHSRGGSVGYWLVDDLDGAIQRALELGGKVYRGPLRVPEVQRTIAQIEDAQGNIFGIEAKFKT